MPSLRGSGKLIEFPASIKRLAHHCNLPFPVSLRQLIANPDCPPRPSVTLTVDPERIQKLQSTTLSWASTDATSATIDVKQDILPDEISAVPTSGSMSVRAVTIGYIMCKITVTGPGGTSTVTKWVQVA